jgi:hypothetical protein
MACPDLLRAFCGMAKKQIPADLWDTFSLNGKPAR